MDNIGSRPPKNIKTKNRLEVPTDPIGVIARCLADHHVGNAAGIAAAVLDGLVSAPEDVRVGLIRVLMADPQCLICGDLLD